MSKNREALDLIAEYGGIDGGHHKQWLLDQVVRVLTGCPVVTGTAVDCNGKPYAYDRLGESKAYLRWRRLHADGEDGPDTYSWDEGVPP